MLATIKKEIILSINLALFFTVIKLVKLNLEYIQNRISSQNDIYWSNKIDISSH
jgi:hypothetical protein